MQSIVIFLFSVYVLKLHVAGLYSLCIIIMIIMSFAAVSVGALISIFANNELQLVQFIRSSEGSDIWRRDRYNISIDLWIVGHYRSTFYIKYDFIKEISSTLKVKISYLITLESSNLDVGRLFLILYRIN